MTRYISEFTGVRDIYEILQLGRQVVHLSSKKTGMLPTWQQLIINHVIHVRIIGYVCEVTQLNIIVFERIFELVKSG